MELEKNEINNINEKQSKNTERAESSVLNSKKIKNKSDFLNEKSLQDQFLSLEFDRCWLGVIQQGLLGVNYFV